MGVPQELLVCFRMHHFKSQSVPNRAESQYLNQPNLAVWHDIASFVLGGFEQVLLS